MADQKLEITVGGQPVNVAVGEEHIEIATVHETLLVSSDNGAIRLTIKEERLDFSSPWILEAAGGGGAWPFGVNPNRVDGIVRDTPAMVDRVVMPGQYRVVKWLLLLSDESTGMAVTSEIKAFRRGAEIWFTEYAILGDSSLIPYGLDVQEDGDAVQLMVTSGYDGVLTARTMKIGIFS